MRIKNIEVDQKWNRGVLRLVFRSSDWLIDLVQSISSNEKALFWKPIKVRYFFRKDIPIQFPLIMQFINFGIPPRPYAVQEGINLSVRSQLAIFPIRTIFIGYDRIMLTISVFVRLRSVFTDVMRTIVYMYAWDLSCTCDRAHSYLWSFDFDDRRLDRIHAIWEFWVPYQQIHYSRV